MAFPISYSAIDDKDFDDAALWAVIDSAAAAAVSSSKTRKSLALNCINKSSPSPPPKYPKSPITPHQAQRSSRVSAEGEVVQEPWVFQPPRKIARTCSSEMSESSPLAVVCNNALRTPVHGPVYLSPEAFLSPQMGSGSEGSPASCGSGLNEGNGITRHSLSGQFPSVSLFKEYQNAAMAILEKSDFTMIAGSPFIKKSGWRKISFYFNLSFEIKDKTIEFDENRNVQRAEFVVRAYMQGGRFCDGWGSCERREKRFIKPNHDIPSTAETRAKNKACQVSLNSNFGHDKSDFGHSMTCSWNSWPPKSVIHRIVLILLQAITCLNIFRTCLASESIDLVHAKAKRKVLTDLYSHNLYNNNLYWKELDVEQTQHNQPQKLTECKSCNQSEISKDNNNGGKNTIASCNVVIFELELDFRSLDEKRK